MVPATHTPRIGASRVYRDRFPHSDIPGSKLVCQLPEAFRRLLRPSSASCAKASTVYPYRCFRFWKLEVGCGKLNFSNLQFPTSNVQILTSSLQLLYVLRLCTIHLR